MKTHFKSVNALAETEYFKMTKDGALTLRHSFSYGIIDLHTHIGWRYVPHGFRKLAAETVVRHQFPVDSAPIHTSKYSASDFPETLVRHIRQEMVKSAVAASSDVRTYTPENLTKEMERMGIVYSVVLPIDMLSLRNTKNVIAACNKHTMLLPFGSIHPRSLTKKLRFHAIEKNIKGLKIHPGIQMVRPNHPGVIRLCALAASARIPVLFHCGYSPLQPAFQKRFAHMNDFEDLVKKSPDTQIILGHAGIDQYECVGKMGAKYPNVYAEVSGQPPDAIRYLIHTMGSDRLLFGSDWPIYPSALPLYKVLVATEFDTKVRKKILCGNAEKLLHIHV